MACGLRCMHGVSVGCLMSWVSANQDIKLPQFSASLQQHAACHTARHVLSIVIHNWRPQWWREFIIV